MTAEVKKIKLIKQIAETQDRAVLEQIESILDKSFEIDLNIKNLVKPIKNKIDIEQLKKEQNYKGFDKREVDQLIKEIDLQEPLEDLIRAI